jgi:hypothetical protein
MTGGDGKMYEVILIPYDERLNEYATPCIFYFDTYDEIDYFLTIVFEHGNRIEVTINNCGTE